MDEQRISDDDLVACWQDITGAVTRVNALAGEMVEESGVPAQWLPVLSRLLGAEGHRLPMTVLARDMAMTSGGFSKLADRMARDGLIDRRGTPDDRRVINATLTEQGLEAARRSVSRYQEALRKYVLADLAAADLLATGMIMRRLASPGAEPEPSGEFEAHEREPGMPDRRASR